MALQSKDFYVFGQSANGTITFTYILRVTENSTDASNNTSNVTIQAILKQNYNGLTFSQWTTFYSCTINGSQVFSTSAQKALSGTSEHIYHTWTGNIPHDEDGTLNITVGGSLSVVDPEGYHPQPLTIVENSSNAMVLTPIAVYTACGAPTDFSANVSVFEDSIDLSWSGATAGKNNSVAGYLIAAARSQGDGIYEEWFEVWDTEDAGEGCATLTADLLAQKGVDVPRGEYVILWIQTKGSAGKDYCSEWKRLPPIRKNRLPTVPSTVSVSQELFRNNEVVTVSWDAASDPDNNLEKYIIEHSSDNTVWQTLTECDHSAGAFAFTPSQITDQPLMYLRICAVDDLGAAGDFVPAGVLTRNNDPAVSIYDGVWNKHLPTITAKGRSEQYMPKIYCGGAWNDYPGTR